MDEMKGETILETVSRAREHCASKTGLLQG